MARKEALRHIARNMSSMTQCMRGSSFPRAPKLAQSICLCTVSSKVGNMSETCLEPQGFASSKTNYQLSKLGHAGQTRSQLV